MCKINFLTNTFKILNPGCQYNYEETHDTHIYPQIPLMESPLLQETVAIQQTKTKHVLEAFSAQVGILVDNKRLKRILEQG